VFQLNDCDPSGKRLDGTQKKHLREQAFWDKKKNGLSVCPTRGQMTPSNMPTWKQIPITSLTLDEEKVILCPLSFKQIFANDCLRLTLPNEIEKKVSSCYLFTKRGTKFFSLVFAHPI